MYLQRAKHVLFTAYPTAPSARSRRPFPSHTTRLFLAHTPSTKTISAALSPSHTMTMMRVRYTPRSTNPWQPGGGAARYLLCLSDSARSAPNVSPFFHFCPGLSLHLRPHCSSFSAAKTPFASLLAHQSGIQAERRNQHEQRMRWAMRALIRCPHALPAPQACVLAIEASFPCPRPYPWL
jgi:hypothetical protein